MLRDEFDMPVIGVVEPGARAAVAATQAADTSASSAPPARSSPARTSAPFARSIPTSSITARACPLFVPLVEEGWTDHDATRLVAREYLEPLHRRRHRHARPRLHALSAAQAAASRGARPDVRLIDSAEETAAETARTLAASIDRRRRRRRAAYRFVASDDPLQFLQLGQRFLGGTMEGVEIRTLG